MADRPAQHWEVVPQAQRELLCAHVQPHDTAMRMWFALIELRIPPATLERAMRGQLVRKAAVETIDAWVHARVRANQQGAA